MATNHRGTVEFALVRYKGTPHEETIITHDELMPLYQYIEDNGLENEEHAGTIEVVYIGTDPYVGLPPGMVRIMQSAEACAE